MILICLSLFLSPIWGAPIPKDGEKVLIQTEDGWTLAARYHPADQSAVAVAMFHGLMAGKDEWVPFEKALADRGVATLAVDLRGHGESVRKGKRKITLEQMLQNGPSEEWRNIPRDAQAAYRFLESKGYARIGFMGASVGANAAAMAAHSLSKLRFLVLLSPGTDYQGLTPAGALQVYGPRPLLLVASDRDGYAMQSCSMFRNLRFTARLPVEWIQAPAGHGVQMFQDSTVTSKVISWILDSPGVSSPR